MDPSCGQIWYAEGGGDFLSKGRPVVVMQSDSAIEVDSITIGLLTTNTDSMDVPLVRVPILPTEQNGLRTPSWLMVDKIQTVKRRRLKRLIGTLEENVVADVRGRFVPFLGCTTQSRTLWAAVSRGWQWSR